MIIFSNYSFPIALTYINWKTDAIVGTELLRYNVKETTVATLYLIDIDS